VSRLLETKKEKLVLDGDPDAVYDDSDLVAPISRTFISLRY